MGVADGKSAPVKLYLRLPVKIADEQQVRDLHPGILRVSLPRQKSRRWCIVEFDSTTAKAGVKELKAVKIDGKKVFVNVHRKKDKEEQQEK
ncbi:uncharacterized protein LOC135142026 isoform X2 [Zophobas morio]|uniref:uncharacterized protein LOC135142026 isoform X2 n=1 Tax=Zophobas morio TaxID=2755281 RepID=UPI0030834BE1